MSDFLQRMRERKRVQWARAFSGNTPSRQHISTRLTAALAAVNSARVASIVSSDESAWPWPPQAVMAFLTAPPPLAKGSMP